MQPCLRNLWVGIIILVLGGTVYITYDLHQNDYEPHQIAWFVAGVMVMLTLPISLLGVAHHLNNYTKPNIQRYVIRIIWMAPIYAIDCWLALRFKGFAIYINTARECYEAYVIYSFTFYLIAVVAESEEALVRCLEHKEPMHHLMPFCCLPKWTMGKQFLKNVKNGVISFAVLKIITSIVALFLEYGDLYHEGSFDPIYGYFWIALITNFSQIWAMYCLFQFYHVMATELAPINPFPKFLCIKLVVFFSYWQSVTIAILVHFQVITANAAWTEYTLEDVSSGLNDFLLCLEMFIAAVAHLYAFSHEDYKIRDSMDHAERHRMTCCEKLKSMFDVSDVGADMYHHIVEVGKPIVSPVARPIINTAHGGVRVAKKAGRIMKENTIGRTNSSSRQAMNRSEDTGEEYPMQDDQNAVFIETSIMQVEDEYLSGNDGDGEDEYEEDGTSHTDQSVFGERK